MLAMRSTRAVALAATILLAPATALAQQEPPYDPAIDVNLFEYAAGPKSFFTVADADVGLKGQLTLDVVVTYLSQPFTVYNVDASGGEPMIDDTRTEVVEQMFAGALVGAYGLTDGIQLDATLPVIFTMTGKGLDPSTGMASPDGLKVTGLGDLRVEAKARVWQNDNFKLAAAGGLTVPSSFGSGGSDFLGDDLPALRLRLAGQWTAASGRMSFGGNLGAIFRKPREIYATEIGQQLTWNVGAMVRLTNRLSVVGESFGRTGLVSFDHDSSPLEVLGGLRIVASRSLQVVAGGGAGLVSGIGSPEARLFVSVGYAPDTRDGDGDGISNARDRCPTVVEDVDRFEDGDGCPDVDNDKDRRADAEDKCPNEAEDIDGFDDDDGCPELDNDGDAINDFDDKCGLDKEDGKEPFPADGCPADKRDSDGDNLADMFDACPMDEEDADGFEDWDGCPEADNDKDGVADGDDRCALCMEDKDGFADDDGCPELDNDNDGVLEPADKCPSEAETINGVDDGDGCPDTGGAEVVRLDGDALRVEVVPKFDRRGLARAGQIVVDQMAMVMRQHPEVAKWLVAVSAKKKADADKHARWIVERLIARGVPGERLEVLAAEGPARIGAVIQERVEGDVAAAAVGECPAGSEVTPREQPPGAMVPPAPSPAPASVPVTVTPTPTPTPTPAPTPVAGNATPMPDDQLVMWMGPSSVIAFEKYTTEFQPGATAELDKLAGILVQFGGAKLIVNAHTDKRAKKAAEVTQAQADAVKAYLVGKGVAADRITAVGKGAAEPVDKRNKEKNRRIELDIANP